MDERWPLCNCTLRHVVQTSSLHNDAFATRASLTALSDWCGFALAHLA